MDSTRLHGRTVAKIVGGVVVSLLLVAGGCVVLVYKAVELRDVGPDADEMGKDRLLHLELDDASAGRLRTSQGHEGGIAPAFANSTSSASRVWRLHTDDWYQPLQVVVTATDSLDTRWSRVSCHEDSVSFTGHRTMTVEEELIGATVWISVRNINSASMELFVELSSSDEHSVRPPGFTEDLYLGREACTPEVVALAEQVHGRVTSLGPGVSTHRPMEPTRGVDR